MDSFYVYVYHDSDGNPFYVGKGNGNRSKVHLHACQNSKRRSYRTMFYTKLRKMARLGETPSISILEENLTEKDAFQREKHYIAFWGRRDIKTGCLCNHSDGGEGQTGHQHSLKSRQRMREVQTPRLREMAKAQRGKKLSASHRAKMSVAAKGRERKLESIKKTAAAHRGMKRSTQTCLRISMAKSNLSEETCERISRARKIPVVALDTKTREDLMKFDSATDASHFFGISNAAITHALRCNARTSAGCRWRYA